MQTGLRGRLESQRGLQPRWTRLLHAVFYQDCSLYVTCLIHWSRWCWTLSWSHKILAVSTEITTNLILVLLFKMSEQNHKHSFLTEMDSFSLRMSHRIHRFIQKHWFIQDCNYTVYCSETHNDTFCAIQTKVTENNVSNKLGLLNINLFIALYKNNITHTIKLLV